MELQFAMVRLTWFFAPVAIALAIAPSTTANACGGTFCDAVPPSFSPMPVDQRGEDILFVVEGGTVEVHIRIAYEGEAERFAWIVPLQGLPEVRIGVDAMFDWLGGATLPSWTSTPEYDCPANSTFSSSNGASETGSYTGDGDGDGDGGGGGGPEIVLQKEVGAFEVVVLQGGTAAEVLDFLQTNDYESDPQAEPILQDYLDRGFLFAALKLTASADADEIHPLVFEFPGDEPCVPIRLTAIAAKDDMDIRAYFLGDTGWTPSNYAHVVLNPLAYRWSDPSPERYEQLLGAAIDEADGRGFVTEFHGDIGWVPYSVSNPLWIPSEFIGIDPVTAISLIPQQQLNQHPLIQPLLMEFIPPPPNVDPLDFWNNIASYAAQIDLDAWGDGSGFAAALDERIVQPGLHVHELFDQWPLLTALHTKMSPFEMTVDPTFHPAQDLPISAQDLRNVTQQVLCGGGDSIYHVHAENHHYPVCVPAGRSYPHRSDMPAALRLEQIPMVGPPQVVTDNLPLILESLAKHEASVTCEAEAPGWGDGDPGCTCSTAGSAPLGLGLGFVGLGLFLVRRRRA